MSPQLAYLACINPTPNTYVGGILVVEPSGLPIEFRYSEPVQPNKMQGILYGNTLAHHIKVEIIGENLIKSVETPYDALFIKEDILLNIQLPESDGKLFRLSETKNIPIGTAGNIKLQATNDFLFQATQEGNPLRFFSPPQRNWVSRLR